MGKTCEQIQPSQRSEKRISDHIRNMKVLQRFGTFKEDTHKSLLSYRLAVNGVQNLCDIPRLNFDPMIDPKWPLAGTVDFRRLIEKKYEFPIADALYCFWPIGFNLSGNPYLSAKEALNLDLRSNTLLLIGGDEERMANGT